MPRDEPRNDEEREDKRDEGETHRSSADEEETEQGGEVRETTGKVRAYHGVDMPVVQCAQHGYGDLDDLPRQAKEVFAKGRDEAARASGVETRHMRGTATRLWTKLKGLKPWEVIEDHGQGPERGREARCRKRQEPSDRAIGLPRRGVDHPPRQDDEEDTDEGQLEGGKEQGMRNATSMMRALRKRALTVCPLRSKKSASM